MNPSMRAVKHPIRGRGDNPQRINFHSFIPVPDTAMKICVIESPAKAKKKKSKFPTKIGKL